MRRCRIPLYGIKNVTRRRPDHDTARGLTAVLGRGRVGRPTPAQRRAAAGASPREHCGLPFTRLVLVTGARQWTDAATIRALAAVWDQRGIPDRADRIAKRALDPRHLRHRNQSLLTASTPSNGPVNALRLSSVSLTSLLAQTFDDATATIIEQMLQQGTTCDDLITAICCKLLY